MKKRVFLIVMDSFGVGYAPDAEAFGDAGSNTLGAIRNHPLFSCPNLARLGLFHVDGVGGGVGTPIGAYGRMTERSAGKDTTVGHWELAGLISQSPLPTYPDGFPDEVISAFTETTGYGVLCNKPYSGTDVIRDYGEEHLRTGKLIVYTSADSVFQIAAHESIVPREELYRVCRAARGILVGKHGVGRVIARPFAGEHPFRRTDGRHDFSLVPPKPTLLNLLSERGLDVIAVGKINDIFAGSGVTKVYPEIGNDLDMKRTLELAKSDFYGLAFINLVDFDMLYGHRNDVAGYAKAASDFDRALGKLLPLLGEDDLLVVTADHGCDPSTPSTDHSRERVPLLCFGAGVKAVNIGTRASFADLAATLAEAFGVEYALDGTSFWKEISE